MDWQSELNSSFSWFFYTLAWVSASFGVVLFLLTKYTQIGQKFWLITKPCLKNTHLMKAGMMVLLLIAFVLIEVRISVLNTFFYNGLYTALQEMQIEVFWFFALINASLMGIKVIQEIVDILLGQIFEIKWLEKLNGVLVSGWLQHKNYYRLAQSNLDNIDQRIEQDATAFVTDTLEMVRGVLNAALSSIEFSIVLWGLSGVLVLFGVPIPKGAVFFVYIFIIVATAVSVWIGKPLIRLNFEKEHRHADYRYALVRVRDHAESIAFYQGEHREKQTLGTLFSIIIENRWAIVKRSLLLNGFNTGVTQFAMLLPIMLQAPRFFAGQIKFGDVHQTVQAFNRLMRALSFFRLFYESFTLYQARLNRLHGFLTALDSPHPEGINPYTAQHPSTQSPPQRTDPHAAGLILEAFGLIGSDGTPLFTPVSTTLYPSDRLLIKGVSGIGKTSLMRAMAGIYPLPTTGQIHLNPTQRLHFIPQKPYVPQGTLRAVLHYPDLVADDTHLNQILSKVGLSQLTHRLDEIADWHSLLSPGQLQRIGFVRVLLSRPEVIFLDEASSALDEGNERQMYTLLATELKDAIIVSIGHRSSLEAFHNKELILTTSQPL